MIQVESTRRTPAEIERNLNEIVERICEFPVLDERSADEIVGYDEFGVPQ